MDVLAKSRLTRFYYSTLGIKIRLKKCVYGVKNL
jgi:hypothetical protein